MYAEEQNEVKMKSERSGWEAGPYGGLVAPPLTLLSLPVPIRTQQMLNLQGETPTRQASPK